MEDDKDLELEFDQIEANLEGKAKMKNRFEQLSEKVILTSKEKDEANARAKAQEDARLEAEKERDFYKNFSAGVARYPEAGAYQEQILEKVKAGYDPEDAMLAVLAREGKLGTASQTQEAQQAYAAEGGSAQTTFDSTPALDRMTPDDKLAALAEAEKDGSLVAALRGR